LCWITSHLGILLWRDPEDSISLTGFTSEGLEPCTASPAATDKN